MKKLYVLTFLLAFFFSQPAMAQQQGQAKIDSLLTKLHRAKEDTHKVDILNTLSEQYLKTAGDTALYYAGEAKSLAEQLKFKKGLSCAYFNFGNIYHYQNNYSEAIKYFLEALKINEEIGDKRGSAEVYRNIGYVYISESNYPEVAKNLVAAAKIYEELGETRIVASVYDDAGNAYFNQGNYPQAIKYYFTALKEYEKVGYKWGIAAAYNNIGTVYFAEGNYPEALKNHSNSLALKIEIGDKPGIANSYDNIGLIYTRQGNYAAALKQHLAAMTLFEEIGSKSRIALDHGYIGYAYHEQRKYPEALKELSSALEIGNASYLSTIMRARVYNLLGDTHTMLNQAGEGKKWLQKGSEISQAIGAKDVIEQNYRYLAKADSALGNFKSAFANHKLYMQYHNSLFNEENTRELTQTKMQYEFDKKAAITQAEHEKESLRQRSYLIAAASVIILLLVLFYLQRLRARKNKQLLEKGKEVEHTKATFFANISHEFRTPLTLILGPLESMLQQENDPDRRGLYSLMQRNARRLLHQVNEILDLSKIEAKQLHLQAQQVDLHSFVSRILVEFQPLAEDHQTVLSFKTDTGNFQAVWDAERLETILFNLLSNALKHTINGNVTVGILSKDKPDQYQIYVTDTGTGIPPEKRGKVFDRFYHEDNFRGDSTGTGIGLELTKELVELHGGSIEVESELGKGTTFTLTMPLVPPFAREAALIKEPETTADFETGSQPGTEQGNDESESNQKPLLLIIEDNEDMRQYLRSILRDKYRVIEAQDGLKGVEVALEEIPDLIVSDVMMPGKNGYEVCSELKQDFRTSHIPIILLTAKSSPEDRITGLEQEADYYLSKPFIPRELLVSIQNLIERRKKLQRHYTRQHYLKPPGHDVPSTDEQFIIKLMEILENHYRDSGFSVEQLSREIGMSRSQLHRKLHALTNESISKFIRNYRLQCAMELIEKSSGSVSEICYEVGFNSPSYFNKCFLEFFGRTPTEAMKP